MRALLYNNVQILPSKDVFLPSLAISPLGQFQQTQQREKMSDVAHCPCCGAAAKVTRDEHGIPVTFKAVQDQELLRKVRQLKRALSRFIDSKNSDLSQSPQTNTL